MRSWPSLPSPAWQSELIGDCSECNANMIEQQRLASKRNKNMTVEGAYGRRFFR